MKRTSPPSWYRSPLDAEIIEKAREMNISRRFSLDLARDLSHAAAFVMSGEAAEKCIVPLIPTNKELEYQLEYHLNVQKFITACDYENASGETPLEKALSIIEMLSAQEGGDGDEDGDALPIFTRSDGESVAKNLSAMRESIADLTDFEQEMLEVKNMGREQAVAKLSDPASRALLELSCKLKKMIKFKARSSRKPIVSATARDKRTVGMTEYAQISRLRPLSQIALPDFEVKFAQKALRVYERVEYKKEKQVLYLLLDQSGSMNEPDRVGYVLAVLLNRLEAVVKGEAVLYVSLFDDKITQPQRIENVEEAKKIFQQFRRWKPNGGGTKIDSAVKYAAEWIEKNGGAESVRPDICLVTDGEDSVQLKKSDLRGARLHYFAIASANNALADIARFSDGVFIEL